MKAFAITQREFKTGNKRCLSASESTIKGEHIYYALVDVDEPHFDPEINRNHVLVRKKAFSCNYRDNAVMIQVQRKLNEMPQDMKQYYAFGSEFSGIVEKVGNEVTEFKIGDRVIANGQYPFTGNKQIIPGLPTNQASLELEIIHGGKLLKIPDTMPFEYAAAFTVGAQTTYSMIDKLQIEDGKNILITGLNSNTSLFALHALQQKNVRICGLVRNETTTSAISKLELNVESIVTIKEGSDALIQHDDLRAFINNYGRFDYVIDPFSDYYFTRIIDLLNVNAKYVTCGISNQFSVEKKELGINQIFAKIIMNNITIIGNCLGDTRDLERALHDFENGCLRLTLGGVYEGTETEAFFNKTFLSNGSIGKIVFKY